MHICIFTVNGATLWFHDVAIDVDDEKILHFTYKSKHDGLSKTGNFTKATMAGYSRWDG